ncbi:CcoQ/FixQ family Cbb3-type cytochrome c oxidase assembly chaperone [Pontibaca salina]|uniref:CcoQ/FixQ family Cbb3-type cytochrome c oxidase assembly chaperone n=1 Tax=Pontibaca salina TaxID=2795731 RepID=A0A934M267_9RHOB|nr:CcoQ/FixQ family Cbb3-type cytochrome c oxidase assembly chaperone [Pontibaca salina]MBI6630341.1 CcoQ/FixQ family Cbb3-type cytochrome c oxidase assembly chaperone [Pontibaca salina]
MNPDTETYSVLRQFADSWMLLLLFVFFVGVVFWVFRPGSKKTYDDTANIPFRHEDKPSDATTDEGENSEEEGKK